MSHRRPTRAERFQARARRPCDMKLEFVTMINTSKSSVATKKLVQSSGNIFADLGFDAAEAENLRIRAELMIHITRLIEDRKLTDAVAAKVLRVGQLRVNQLIRGHIHLFSAEELIAMLSRLGLHVRFIVEAM